MFLHKKEPIYLSASQKSQGFSHLVLPLLASRARSRTHAHSSFWPSNLYVQVCSHTTRLPYMSDKTASTQRSTYHHFQGFQKHLVVFVGEWNWLRCHHKWIHVAFPILQKCPFCPRLAARQSSELSMGPKLSVCLCGQYCTVL